VIARRFEVSRFYVYQVRDREQQSGVRSSFQIGGHRRSRVEEAEPTLRRWIAAEPGLTLEQLRERLAAQGIAVKVGALWHQLNKWNLTFSCTPASKNARTYRQRGWYGMKRSRRWTSKSWYLSMKPGLRPT
jgi:transposase